MRHVRVESCAEASTPRETETAMQLETIIHTCAKLASPVLTVYVNTSDQDATRHPRVRPELAWLVDAAATLRRGLSHHDLETFNRQVQRFRRFLEQRRAAERAIVIFSGEKFWQVVALHVSLKNDLHSGKPNIGPLLPLLHAHRRYGVVVMGPHGCTLLCVGTGRYDFARQQDV